MIYLAKQVMTYDHLDPAPAAVEGEAAASQAACIQNGGTYCAQLAKAIREADADVAETLREEIAAQIASIYSEAELRAFVAFAESPAGKAAQEKGPKVQAALAGLLAKALRNAHTQLNERYCVAVGCMSLLGKRPSDDDGGGVKPR